MFFQREWQSDTYWERYKLNISDITLRLGNKDVFWSSESDSTANQNAKVGHIWSHIDILFVHYILITNFLNSLNPLSFWFFIQINEKKTNMKNIGYYKILFCSIQVWSITTEQCLRKYSAHSNNNSNGYGTKMAWEAWTVLYHISNNYSGENQSRNSLADTLWKASSRLKADFR